MQNKPIWVNTEESISKSSLYKFIRLIAQKYNFLDDSNFYQWSIDYPELFWQEFMDYSKIILDSPAEEILKRSVIFQNNRWFYKAKLNFARNLLDSKYNQIRDNLEPNYPALIALNEKGEAKSLGIKELKNQVAQLVLYFKSKGVKTGDRIAGFIPNISEAVISMLAATSLGAVWTACSPDFGEDGVLERFSQIDIKILIIVPGYSYKNKYHSCEEKNKNIISKLNLKSDQIILINQESQNIANNELIIWSEIINNKLINNNLELKYTSIDYNDPVYIVFSSGTTGKPKCIVHGAGGVLTEHFKEHLLHHDLSPQDKLFYFTSTSWMMWHWQLSALGLGATILIYDGAPNFPQEDSLINLIDQYGITVFGASAKYFASLEKNQIIFNNKNNSTLKLSTLRMILSTGSPLMAEQYKYIYSNIKQDVALCSISGGTDLLGCFALGNVILPIYIGELQSRSLGLAVRFYNEDGQEVKNQKAELVCTAPFPSMPLYFWNDPDGQIYYHAYFAKFNNIWAHGDYGKLTNHDGVILYGRSDTVLNPSGVRIGTAEIYAIVEKMPEVLEALAVGQLYNNDERVVLFVVLKNNLKLDQDLSQKIKQEIKSGASPRHVPAVIIQAPELPRTSSGKLVELAVKNVIAGLEVKNKQALANPKSLDYFMNLAELK